MNIKDLEKEQLRLAKKVIVKDEFDEIDYVGGVDQAFVNEDVISAVVVLERKTLKVVEKKYAVMKAQMQYIPGFLSYREGPAIVEAVRKLEQRPDLLFVDGHGILHPRKIGLASHVGILLDMPTIGVAKKPLLGDTKDGKIWVGDEVLGLEVITKEYAKPIFVSPGHRVGFRTAEKMTRELVIGGHKMPEPLHEAHKYVNKVRERILGGGK
ncbi:TPA: endonuclease V [Candidatus Woesearchaeota archaeon]|nr:endonuclease V [Candidatus Woesearchaeota archaeon]